MPLSLTLSPLLRRGEREKRLRCCLSVIELKIPIKIEFARRYADR
jgi:hypothetical protein